MGIFSPLKTGRTYAIMVCVESRSRQLGSSLVGDVFQTLPAVFIILSSQRQKCNKNTKKQKKTHRIVNCVSSSEKMFIFA